MGCDETHLPGGTGGYLEGERRKCKGTLREDRHREDKQDGAYTVGPASVSAVPVPRSTDYRLQSMRASGCVAD